MQRKLNGLLVLFSLFGGLVGFAAGEAILHRLTGELPTYVIVGLYIGVLALCIGLSCLIAEMISPRLNGSSWRQQYSGLSWKLLVPSTLVLLFVIGLGLQFIYGLNLNGAKPVKNIVLVIDNSGSMVQTDPNDDRYDAAKALINKMDSSNQVAIVTFSDEAELLQPFTYTTSNEVKEEIFAKIEGIRQSDGGTNFEAALYEAMSHIQQETNTKHGTMVILLSDGFSPNFNVNTMLTGYTDKEIAIHTIGLSLVDADGAGLLQLIASHTGGVYYDVADAGELSFIFEKIYSDTEDRTLLTERTGGASGSAYYKILRFLSFVMIGAAIGLALGIVFDNRYLARSFAIGGAVSGMLAGLILEYGLSGTAFLDGTVRLIAALLLAGIMTMFTLVVPIRESGGGSLYRQQRQAGSSSRASSNERPRERRSRGF